MADAQQTDFMLRPMWFGITRWTWVRLAYVFVVLVGALGLLLVQRNFDADEQREAAEDYQSCLRGNETRGIIREVVILATEGGGATDLTTVPGFVELDKSTQQFLINLRDATTPEPGDEDSPDSFRRQALNLLELRDCEREFPEQAPSESEPSALIG